MNTIWLSLSLCVVGFVVGCDQGKPPLHVTGNLPSNDVAQIERAVREGIIVRFHSSNGYAIKSINVTTNNSYEWDRLLVSRLSSRAETNPAVEPKLYEAQKRLQTERPRPAVEVWYADKNARRGEAGFLVEKGSNGWEITSELYR
jgi:hypothetical protein